MTADPGLCKVCVCIPPEFADALMDAVNGAMEPVYPGYDRAYSIVRSTGTWRPLEGSDPYDGVVGRISTVEELRIGFVVRRRDLAGAIEAVLAVHPYEEPCIEVVPLIDWKGVVTRPCI